MKNSEVIVCLNMIGRIKSEDRKLSILLSYALNANMKKLQEAYRTYLKVLQERNLADKDPKQLTAEERKELKELKNAEVHVDLYRLTLDQIMGSDLTINEMEVIQTFMMKEGDD